jgi:CDGSH-type Zn-finger protein
MRQQAYIRASPFIIRHSSLTVSSMTTITVGRNGNLRVDGDFTIVDADGNEYGLGGRTVVSLCRCGHSQNKPYCDGSHKRVGFEEEAKAFDLPPKA